MLRHLGLPGLVAALKRAHPPALRRFDDPELAGNGRDSSADSQKPASWPRLCAQE